MNEQTESLILEHLRAIRAKLDEHDLKFENITQRVGSLEKHVAVMQGDIVDIRHSIDRMEVRLSRIEKRLDIVEEPV